MSTTTTPADLTITPRDLRVDRNARNARWWHGGDPVATAYFNALSAAFPQGETFFIESVRRYRDSVHEPLREQIAAFVQQESMHTREHVVFNKLLHTAGYDTTAMDAQTRRRVDEARARPPIVKLALTVALEHFTAIMAHALLTEREPLPGASEDIVRLWQWHAIEEIEHKAVAYDTFVAVTQHIRPGAAKRQICHITQGKESRQPAIRESFTLVAMVSMGLVAMKDTFKSRLVMGFTIQSHSLSHCQKARPEQAATPRSALIRRERNSWI
jgi:predicted metal-dependent hydrolase